MKTCSETVNIRLVFFVILFASYFCQGYIGTLAYAQLNNSSWPMFANNPQHTGQSSVTGPTEGEKIWDYIACETSCSSSYQASPAIASDGTIYFGASNYDTGFRLYALQPNGSLKWFYESKDCYYNCRFSSPAIGADGTIYINTSQGFYAINSNGTLKWSAGNLAYSGCNELASPAIAPDGTIYVGGSGLYAVTPAGGIKWVFDNITRICSSPAIDLSGTIYVANLFAGKGLYAINPDGSLKWTYELDNPWFYSSPAIDRDGTIYIGLEYARDSDSGLLAINKDGTLKWNFPMNGHKYSTAAIAEDNTIYFPSAGFLYAINPDGTLKSIVKIDGEESAHAAIEKDGTIYASGGGQLLAISPSGGIKWSYKFPSSFVTPIPGSPAIGPNGSIYLFADELVFDPGDRFIVKLYAIGNLLNPWPQGLCGSWCETWMGWVNDVYFPWGYHDIYGWIYVFGTDPNNFWFYNQRNNDYWWTTADLWPYIYFYNERGWFYNQPGTNWFVNLTTGQWVQK